MIKVDFLTFHWRKFVTCAFSGKGLLAQAPIKRGRVKLAWTMPSVRRFDKVNLAPCAFNNTTESVRLVNGTSCKLVKIDGTSCKLAPEDINACSNRHCEERSNLALCAFNNYSNILIL